MEVPGAENVFQIVQDIERSSQVTLETFQQQLQLICNLQQQTLEDVSVVQSGIADILNRSIEEIEHFQSNLLTAQMTSAVKGENEINDIIHTDDKKQHTGNIEEEDCVGKIVLLHKAIELSSQHLGTLDSFGLSSESDQKSDTQQNFNVQYTKTDNCKPTESNVLFQSGRVNLLDFRKRDSYTQHKNRTEEADFGSLGISDSTFNENVLLSSTMKIFEFEDIVQDDTLCIADFIQRCDHTYFNPTCKKSDSTLEKTVHNKNKSNKKNFDKLFKSINEGRAGSKTLIDLKSLSESDQVKIPDQLESKPLHKALRQLHINTQFLRSENLQCRNQISRLRTDRTLLHIRLSKAEKDAEAYHQHAKVMTDKCEELLKQRKQIQNESNHLHFEKQLLMKEIELLKEESKTLLEDLSAAITEKVELVQKLDSSKKMALSYAREKQEIHCKWNETLRENYHLRRKADESRTVFLKISQLEGHPVQSDKTTTIATISEEPKVLLKLEEARILSWAELHVEA